MRKAKKTLKFKQMKFQQSQFMHHRIVSVYLKTYLNRLWLKFRLGKKKSIKIEICLIYIKVTVCAFVPFSRPNHWTNLHQILHRPPSCVKNLPTNSGKVLNTSMTPPTWPLDHGLPQTPKPKWVTREETLCNVKCPDGWCKLIKFFPGSAVAQLAGISIYIKQTVCTYPCPFFTPEPPDQTPPNFAQTSPPTQGRFLAQAWPHQPNPWTPGYPKL